MRLIEPTIIIQHNTTKFETFFFFVSMHLEIHFLVLLLLQVSKVWATITSCTIDSSFTTVAVPRGDSVFLRADVALGYTLFLYNISFGSTQSDSISLTDVNGFTLELGSSCTSYTPSTAYVVTGYQEDYALMRFTCNNYFSSCNLAYKTNGQVVTSSQTQTTAPTSISSSSSTTISVSVSQTTSGSSSGMIAAIVGGVVAILGGFGLFYFCHRRRTKLAKSATGGNPQNAL